MDQITAWVGIDWAGLLISRESCEDIKVDWVRSLERANDLSTRQVLPGIFRNDIIPHFSAIPISLSFL